MEEIITRVFDIFCLSFASIKNEVIASPAQKCPIQGNKGKCETGHSANIGAKKIFIYLKGSSAHRNEVP